MSVVLPFALDPAETLNFSERIRRMTDEEFYYFCQDNAPLSFERDADGTIRTMAQTGGETGRKDSELTTELTIWNRQQKGGVVFDSSTGFKLPNGATRGPDVAWVSNAQWNALMPDQKKRFPPLCPEFMVELLSESDTIDGTEAKLREYITNGCQLGWLIDPRTEEVRIYRADGSVSVLQGFNQTLSGESVLPGFSFDLNLLR